MKLPVGLIEQRLAEIIDYLVSKGVYYYGSGAAIGFDTLAAQAVINARRKNPKIKLILVMPCHDQDKKWLPEQRATYSFLKSQANKRVYTSEVYEPGCMHLRNRHLVDNSKFCVCYWERNSGGTAYTVDYAMKQGLEIYNLAQPNFLTQLEYDNHP